MAPETIIHHLSGQQFAGLLRKELDQMNRGFTTVSCESFARSCGLSGKQIRRLKDGKVPNPNTLTVRTVLYTLGYRVANAGDDVVPHLKETGTYDEEMHGPKRKRRNLSAGDLPPLSDGRAPGQ
ncbi:hypothetical protein METH_11180 [Leisingera methylohalidivorans DSM 14336]|uniref:XRE family transcriptional regulator n=1 Tax=Leisingera methylohalidivorans DSM 14336 TaxID=999552 RepID=V9VWD7_9RHOB|nr:hypothetical protein METH_11180 [Leisingera methylohalidivorans DSM 14336]